MQPNAFQLAVGPIGACRKEFSSTVFPNPRGTKRSAIGSRCTPDPDLGGQGRSRERQRIAPSCIDRDAKNGQAPGSRDGSESPSATGKALRPDDDDNDCLRHIPSLQLDMNASIVRLQNQPQIKFAAQFLPAYAYSVQDSPMRRILVADVAVDLPRAAVGARCFRVRAEPQREKSACPLSSGEPPTMPCSSC